MTTPPGDDWPVPADEPAVVLLDAATPFERRLLDEWVQRKAGPGSEPSACLVLPDPRAAEAERLAELDDLLARTDDPFLVPVRVVWLPRKSDDDEPLRFRDVLAALGDPRRPRGRGAERALRRDPSRCLVLAGEPARVSALRQRWTAVGDDRTSGRFPAFVVRQATLALERAETRLVGQQYKVPRLVREELESTRSYRAGVAALARELHRPEEDVAAEASSYLDEMVTGWSRLLVDLSVRLGRYSFGRGYDGDLDFDPGQLSRLRELARRHPLVFLPAHKSNLDTLVMNVALHDAGLPRTHVIGGINMAFWPIGPLWRHAGTVFIRRNTRGNPVYTYTLREYIGYLIEKRFSLQFYIEGSRSRTGKLLPPRLGLLAYVARAFRQGRSEDVVLVPVSIAYDQLQEVGDFAREARGGAKPRESITWLVRAFREQRGRYGRIYVRFGEPLSLRAALGPVAGEPATDADEPDRLALHKVALEVCRRINETTPITATSLVTLSLLGAHGRALTLEQVLATVHDPLHYALRRGLPLTREPDLSTADGVRCALDELTRHHVVVHYDSGPDPVYAIGADQHLAAAFYRNSIIHFFVHGAIAQVALARASRRDVDEPLTTFWSTAYAVRDLLKFEFFFEPRKEFHATLEDELQAHDPEWADRVTKGGDDALELLTELRPLTAPTVLRSFVEAYAVAAATLVRCGDAESDERQFLGACLALGRQYQLQHRISSPESLSKPLFASGYKLAASRGLVGPEADAAAQRALLDELRNVLRDLDVVEALAKDRVLELIARTDEDEVRAHDDRPGAESSP